MTEDREQTQFGRLRVAGAPERTQRVRGVFDRVAERYDIMNDLMSAGLHRWWKSVFLAAARLRPGEVALDVAGGTGDIARGLARQGDDRATVIVCDLTPGMMQVGRRRALDAGLASIRWVQGNAETLPFADGVADLVTIAFGLRNVSRIDTALAEFRRVLRPGGRFLCLEFSQVRPAPLARLYDLYSRAVIPNLGALVAQDRASYDYLVESIRRFPSREDLAQRMRRVGFAQVGVETLSAGIVAIHSGRAS